jgi:hypothetical protein
METQTRELPMSQILIRNSINQIIEQAGFHFNQLGAGPDRGFKHHFSEGLQQCLQKRKDKAKKLLHPATYPKRLIQLDALTV